MHLNDCRFNSLRIYWRLSTISKTSRKVYKVYILKVYLIQFTLRKNTHVKKFPLNKINGAKEVLFFLSQAPNHHSFTFDLQFLDELKHKISLSNIVCGIFHFRFCFIFIEIYIFQQNTWSFYSKTSEFL